MTYNRKDPHHNKRDCLRSYRKLKINGTGNYHLVLGEPNIVHDRWDRKSNGSRHIYSVWGASENMACRLRRCNFLPFLSSLFEWNL